MKNIYSLLLAMLITTLSLAQAPQTMSYQAVIRDASGNLITEQEIGMKISILKGTADGMEVYTETMTPTTNKNGLVSIEIGVEAGFADIDWSDGPYFLKTETDPEGGMSYTISGTNQLLSVPYALHAKSAETVTGGITETDPVYSGSEAANIDATDITNLINLSGVNTGDQDLSTLATKTALGDSTAQVRSEIPDVSGFLTTETDPEVAANFDFTDAADGDLLQFNGTKWVKVTPDYISDYTVTETDVTAHEAALTVTESQISDLGSYIETETQNLSDVISNNNSANGQIKNVTDPTDAQDAVTKAYVDDLLARIEAVENSEPVVLANGITDTRDGNHYEVVKIGNQIWMAENLKYLPSVVGPGTGSETAPYYYVYGYDGTDVNAAKATANYTTYGVVYNWTAAMAGLASSTTNTSGIQGVCPTGWHLPSDAEWTELTDYLGTDAGSKLAGNAILWTDGTLDQNANFGETGFTALPGGYRYSDGAFYDIGFGGLWWGATEFSAASAWYRFMVYSTSSVGRSYDGKEFGFSVRCVRD